MIFSPFSCHASRALALLFVFANLPAFALEPLVVEHNDPISIDNTLSLSKLIDLTLEKYPDATWLTSLETEAMALRQRSRSLIADAPQLGLSYQEATSGTLHYLDANVQVPLWNPGQRDAERRVAEQAQNTANKQAGATKLRVAGLVRGALWDMELQHIRYQQARNDVETFEQLQAKIKRRVELGDLPRADELLAQTELLQKRSVLTLAEAELMHARKRYASVTQLIKIPADYREKLVELKEIQQNHPLLVAISSQIERKQAELNAVKAVGSGQTSVAIGINSDSMTNDPRTNDTESFNIAITVPFGGADHLAPRVAAVNVELNRLMADRLQLVRDLEQAHHEAEHNLQVNAAELQIADELQQVAEQHLAMMQVSFSVGEIDLMDLLKVQSRAQQAVLNAKERAVILQRDQAFYNQAVGVLP